MSWHFSQDAVGQSSEADYAASLASALLKSNRTGGKPYSRGRGTDYLKTSRSGMTSEHSRRQIQNARRSLKYAIVSPMTLSSLAGSLVRILALREKGRDWKTGKGRYFGLRCVELPLRFDPDTYSLRTHQCLFQEEVGLSSVILPSWGMMRSGVLSQPASQVLPTTVLGSGSWPTPRASSVAARLSKELTAFNTLKQSGYRCKLEEAVVLRKYPSLETCTIDEDDKSKMLHPDWLEWLMEWPIGFTSRKPIPVKRIVGWLNKVKKGNWWKVDPADKGEMERTSICEDQTERITAIGDGQVPACVFAAWIILRTMEEEGC